MSLEQPISSKGRAFARQFLRSLPTDYEWAHEGGDRLGDVGSPVKRMQHLRQLLKHPDAEVMSADLTRRHSGSLTLFSLTAGSHVYEVMEGEEEAIVAQRHSFHVGRWGMKAEIGIICGCISQHAIGRLYDRWPGEPRPEDAYQVAAKVAIIGALLATERRLLWSSIAFRHEGVICAGTLRIGHHDVVGEGAVRYGGVLPSLFFDCRTCLPGDKENRQADQVTKAFERIWLTGEGSLEAIEFVPAPQDYVEQRLRMSATGN